MVGKGQRSSLCKGVDGQASSPWVRAGLVLYLLFVFLITALIGFRAFASNDFWKIGDWLINYQGGFVRRGLPGEIFLSLSSWTALPASVFAFGAQILSYIVYFVFTGLLLIRQSRLLPMALLIISPYIFLFQIHDTSGGYRKEIIYFSVLAIVAWSAGSIRRDRFERAMIIVLLAYPMVILAHEMLAVFLPYILAIYIGNKKLDRQLILRIGGLVTPSVIAFAMSLKYPGTAEQVVAICNSLEGYAPTNCHEGGAIGWLQRSAEHGLNKVYEKVQKYHYIESYLFATVLAAIAYIPISTRVRKLWSDTPLRILILISVIGSLPLFVFAVDWGRFIYIHLFSLFIVLLTFEDATLAEQNARTPSLSMHGMWFKRRRRLAYTLLGLFALGYASLWHIPHCCGKPFLSNTTIRLADYIKGALGTTR